MEVNLFIGLKPDYGFRWKFGLKPEFKSRFTPKDKATRRFLLITGI